MVGEMVLGQVCFLVLRLSPIYIMLHIILTYRTNGRSLETLQKAMLVRKSASIG